MSGQSDKPRGDMPATWLRGVLIIVVIALLLGVFGAGNSMQRPEMNAVMIIGIVVMLAGAYLVLMAHTIAGKLAYERRKSGEIAFKLIGMLVCGVGAAMVFLA